MWVMDTSGKLINLNFIHTIEHTSGYPSPDGKSNYGVVARRERFYWTPLFLGTEEECLKFIFNLSSRLGDQYIQYQGV